MKLSTSALIGRRVFVRWGKGWRVGVIDAIKPENLNIGIVRVTGIRGKSGTVTAHRNWPDICGEHGERFTVIAATSA